MSENLTLKINGKDLRLLNLSRHNFTIQEKCEILCRLFGMDGVHTFPDIDASDKNNLRKFKTEAKFDFNWLKDGIYNIDEIANDQETRNVLKNGYSLFVNSTVTVDIPNESKTKLLATLNEYKNKLVEKIKESKPNISKERLDKIICSLNEKFDNEETVNTILKELEDCNISDVSCNTIINGFKSAVNNLITEPEPAPVNFYQTAQRPIFPMHSMHERSIANMVNMYTAPNNISPEAKATLVTRLYNVLSNKDVSDAIYQIQTAPLFVFTEYNHEHDFIIQSFQPNFKIITLHITKNHVRFME